LPIVSINLPIQLHLQEPHSQGVLTRVVGLTLEAKGVNAAVGSYCDITGPDGHTIMAEVVGFGDGKLLLMPFGSIQGIAPGIIECAHNPVAKPLV
jgi:flagellum-specific ATP synthase